MGQKSKCDSVDLSNPPAKPVTFKVGALKGNDGWGTMMIMDGVVPASVTPNMGKWYDYKPLYLESGPPSTNAFLAGEVDAFVGSQPAVWIATRQGLDAKAVATVTMNKKGTTQDGLYIVRDDGSIPVRDDGSLPSFESLVGKKIGLVSLASFSEMYAKALVLAGGGDVDDAQYQVMPFPAFADAVKKGQLDTAPAAEPQITQFRNEGAPVRFLDAMSAISKVAGGGITEHDVQHLMVGNEFAADNEAAVCAFLQDLNAANRYWVENPAEVRQGFLDKKLLLGDPKIYLSPEFPAPPVPDDGMPINVTTGQKIVEFALEIGVVTDAQAPKWNEYVSPLANTK